MAYKVTKGFTKIAVSGQDDVDGEVSGGGDTLTLVAGSNVTITTDASADSVTIASSGGGKKPGKHGGKRPKDRNRRLTMHLAAALKDKRAAEAAAKHAAESRCAAMASGVTPSSLAKLAFAPWFSRTFSALVKFFWAAMNTGVLP